jgi:single-stranded-DNA-specific exonuclease
MQTTKKIICRRDPGVAADDFPADLHPVLARIYAARNVRGTEELDRSLERLHHPDLLKGIDTAIGLLATAIKTDKHILIVADFDTDGATSCALAVRALTAMGAKHVSYVVPDRFRFGYGLTPEIVAIAAQRSPDLLITVDNGISSVEGVRTAHAAGMSVLITDHHLSGDTLPEAEAIVNPNQAGDRFPSKYLAGVGVIFYVMLALRTYLREVGWFSGSGLPEPNLAKLLDLVALGTVADLVPLDHNNRILVLQGLQRINQGAACAGIQALLHVAGRHSGSITAADLGFFIAPRLNAAGRLEDMSFGIECLLADSNSTALTMAQRLDTLNHERRAIEADMQAQAIEAVKTLRLENEALPKGICLFDPDWHQGIVGLVASRIGSARSVPGLHIRDALDAIAARHPDLLRRFGGHAMAAGLALDPEKLHEFRLAFDEEAARHLSEEDLQGEILSDGELAPEDLSLKLASLLRAAGPWGQAFPEPVFDGFFEIVDRRVVGQHHLKMALRCRDHNKVINAIAFRQAPDGVAPDWHHARAAYKLGINEYRGSRSLQLIIEHMEPVRG